MAETGLEQIAGAFGVLGAVDQVGADAQCVVRGGVAELRETKTTFAPGSYGPGAATVSVKLTEPL